MILYYKYKKFFILIYFKCNCYCDGKADFHQWKSVISDMILQKSFQYDDLVLKKRILFFNVENYCTASYFCAKLIVFFLILYMNRKFEQSSFIWKMYILL